MRTIAIIQARMESTRLPGKVLAKIGGQSMLAHVVYRTAHIGGIDELIVATGARAADNPIEDRCRVARIPCFRGSPNDVLNRYYQCARDHKADIIFRVTADSPLLDPIINTGILQQLPGHDYAGAVGYPKGIAQEAITMDALATAWRHATSPHEREHVVTYTQLNGNMHNSYAPLDWPRVDNLSVDTIDDLDLIRHLHRFEPELFTLDARAVSELAAAALAP